MPYINYPTFLIVDYGKKIVTYVHIWDMVSMFGIPIYVTPITDAEVHAKLYVNDQLVQEVTCPHIDEGVYKCEFDDTSSYKGFIVYDVPNYYLRGETQFLRPITSKEVELARKILTNMWVIKDYKLIIYDDDMYTPLYCFYLYDLYGYPSMINVFKRVPIPCQYI